MRVDVVMPQMGESIAEGTITRWLKKVGDTVERDEPIFEISTDKVDAEIPSPSAGTLVEIKNGEGETVPVNEVVAVLETDADAAASASDGDDDAAGASRSGAKEKEAKPAAEEREPAPAKKPAAAESKRSGDGEAPSPDPGLFVSPVVRKIAAEHGVDPSRVPGTGAGGRVTKKDILKFIEEGGAERPAAGRPAAGAAPAPPPSAPSAPKFAPGERTVREPMTQMRKVIAEHMIASRRTSAHVQSVFEADMTHIARLRKRYKAEYADRHGVNLTFMPFIVKAVCDGLRAWPVLNASVDGTDIVYKKDLNVGIAVALDWGLIVPVVRNADDLSIAGLSKRMHDLGTRARSKQLTPDEVQGGTFTITNPGQYGGLFGMPIINQPQVAILGVGGIEKRPVVRDDAIAIRDMVYLCMSYDHRVVDGAVADQALRVIKHSLENFDESLL